MSKTIKTKVSNGPRGEYYEWCRIEDDATITFGNEQGNYAGGTVLSKDFYPNRVGTYCTEHNDDQPTKQYWEAVLMTLNGHQDKEFVAKIGKAWQELFPDKDIADLYNDAPYMDVTKEVNGVKFQAGNLVTRDDENKDNCLLLIADVDMVMHRYYVYNLLENKMNEIASVKDFDKHHVLHTEIMYKKKAEYVRKLHEWTDNVVVGHVLFDEEEQI